MTGIRRLPRTQPAALDAVGPSSPTAVVLSQFDSYSSDGSSVADERGFLSPRCLVFLESAVLDDYQRLCSPSADGLRRARVRWTLGSLTCSRSSSSSSSDPTSDPDTTDVADGSPPVTPADDFIDLIDIQDDVMTFDGDPVVPLRGRRRITASPPATDASHRLWPLCRHTAVGCAAVMWLYTGVVMRCASSE